ncbi:MAG TPA: hypothetical protein VLE72_03475 [Candidatus Saccharimonadales bacterium]|nr:hypothetical protein [Candidatus Saccharimonadales bacterium]
MAARTLPEFDSFEEGKENGDVYRARRNWIGPWSRSLVRAKACYLSVWLDFPNHPDRWQAAQQYGVCLRMQHRPIEGYLWLQGYALPARLPVTIGRLAEANVMRDLGMCYSDARDFERAEVLFHQSLSVMGVGDENFDTPAVDQAATEVQLGRLNMRRGRFGTAAACYEGARYIFASLMKKDENAAMQLLYMLLHEAQNDIARGKPELARDKLAMVYGLRSVGSPIHQVKAHTLDLLAKHRFIVQAIFHTVTMRE